MMSFPIPTLLVSASIFTVLLSIAHGRIHLLLGGNGGSNGGGDDSDSSGGGELLDIPLLFSPAQGLIQLGSQGDNGNGGNNGADIPSSQNSGGRSGGIPVNFPFKFHKASESLESSQNGAALPFSRPVQNAVSPKGNNNNNAAVLSLILSSPLLRRLLLNSRLLHQAYPTLALDVDGDGLIDQLVPSGQPFLLGNDVLSSLVRGSGQHVVGPRIVGPPVKVYQHKRTLHLPTTERHYVQRSVGPAVESDVYQGIPVNNNHFHPGLFAPSHPRPTGFLLRRKRREAANAFEQGAQAAVDNAASEVANDVEEEEQ